jgi:hypothetical protein
MDIDWKDTYLKLVAFAHSWANGRSWFRGEDTTSFLMGKQAHDYAVDAIVKYHENPEKHDPKLGDLLNYLKYHLIRASVGNDLRRKENRLTNDIFKDDEDDDDEDSTSYAERLLPRTEAAFSDDYDYDELKKYIEEGIKGDTHVENIFIGKCLDMLRREIIEDSKMTPDEYDNANRRLKTVVNRALAHFNATKRHEQQKKSKQV